MESMHQPKGGSQVDQVDSFHHKIDCFVLHLHAGFKSANSWRFC